MKPVSQMLTPEQTKMLRALHKLAWEYAHAQDVPQHPYPRPSVVEMQAELCDLLGIRLDQDDVEYIKGL